MGYSIAGFVADHRLTETEALELLDDLNAEGTVEFSGTIPGVVDIIRADDYTFGITSQIDVEYLHLEKGELATFSMETTSGTFTLSRYFNGEKTHELVSFEGGTSGEEGEEFSGFFADPWEFIEGYIKKRTGLTSDIWEKATFERYEL